MARTPSIGSAFYVPAPPPQEVKDLSRYLQDEFLKIETAILALAAGHLDKTTVAPLKPREGDLRFSDGVLWNPTGAGIGFYGYYGGAWHFLG